MKQRGSKPAKNPRPPAAKSLMDAAVDETAEDIGGTPDDMAPEQEVVDYITVRIPLKHIQGMPTVKAQRTSLTPRQARAQRLIYDGMHYAGEELKGSYKVIGTTAPLWHATAWLLDKVADEFGMDPSSLDTLA